MQVYPVDVVMLHECFIVKVSVVGVHLGEGGVF